MVAHKKTLGLTLVTLLVAVLGYAATTTAAPLRAPAGRTGLGRTPSNSESVRDIGRLPHLPTEREDVLPSGSPVDVEVQRQEVSTTYPITRSDWTQVTTQPGGASFALWSPTGERIAYTGWDPAGWYRNVWSINVDGTDPKQLTFFDVAETHGSYSPDGNKLLFTLYHNDSRTDVMVMNADGSDIEPLLTSGYNGEPDWSPDGTQIAFHSGSRLFSAFNIYTMTADGSAITQLTFEDWRTNWAPDWSPDGSKIAFASDRAGSASEERVNIFVMNADGSNPTQLTFGDQHDYAPVWSPDGTKIAFQRRASPSSPNHIYMMDSDGSNVIQLTDSNESEMGPTWSPDGTQIAFQAFVNGHGNIYALALEPGPTPTSPDLSIAGPMDFLGGESPYLANHVVISTTVKNQGVQEADDVIVRFYNGDPRISDSTPLIGETAVGSLTPGEEKTASTLWTLDDDVENAEIHAVAYAQGQQDANAQDNHASRNVSVYYADFRHDVDAYSFWNFQVGYSWSDAASDLLYAINSFCPYSSYLSHERMFGVMLPVVSFVVEQGHCYGMASTSILYRQDEHREIRPVDKTTYQMELEDEGVRPAIRQYQRLQLLTLFQTIPSRFNASKTFDSLVEYIGDRDKTVMLAMYHPGHAVVAYKVVELGDEKRVYLYDNNLPLIGLEVEDRVQPPYGTLRPADNDFLYVTDNYTYTKALVERPLLAVPDISCAVTNRFYRWIIGDLIDGAVARVFVGSPVSPLVTDQYGRRIGYVGDLFVDEIPGASMATLGEARSFDLPADLDYTVETAGTESGTMDLNLVIPTSCNAATQVFYNDVPVDVGSRTRTRLSREDPDWTMDLGGGQTRLPDEIVEIVIHRAYLPLVTRDYGP